jgi:hypothetical protein
MSDFDEQEKRIAQIVSDGDISEMKKTPERILKYLNYLILNLEPPRLVTGREFFAWEEKFEFGYGSQKEYKKLKKTNPSHSDIFMLKGFDKDEIDYKILAKVRRESDKKRFIISLNWLEAVDEESKNYQLLDDYSFWFVNY